MRMWLTIVIIAVLVVVPIGWYVVDKSSQYDATIVPPIHKLEDAIGRNDLEGIQRAIQELRTHEMPIVLENLHRGLNTRSNDTQIVAAIAAGELGADARPLVPTLVDLFAGTQATPELQVVIAESLRKIRSAWAIDHREMVAGIIRDKRRPMRVRELLTLRTCMKTPDPSD